MFKGRREEDGEEDGEAKGHRRCVYIWTEEENSY